MAHAGSTRLCWLSRIIGRYGLLSDREAVMHGKLLVGALTRPSILYHVKGVASSYPGAPPSTRGHDGYSGRGAKLPHPAGDHCSRGGVVGLGSVSSQVRRRVSPCASESPKQNFEWCPSTHAMNDFSAWRRVHMGP